MILQALTMLPFWIIGATIIYTSRRMDPSLTRITWPAVFHFLRFMAYVTVGRILFGSITGVPKLPLEDLPRYASLLGVFWEDAVHVLPALIMARIGLPPFFSFLYLLFSGIAFATGHLYISPVWALFTTIYPTISYRYGKKHGLGTVMICHILYDLITVFTVTSILGRLT